MHKLVIEFVSGLTKGPCNFIKCFENENDAIIYAEKFKQTIIQHNGKVTGICISSGDI